MGCGALKSTCSWGHLLKHPGFPQEHLVTVTLKFSEEFRLFSWIRGFFVVVFHLVWNWAGLRLCGMLCLGVGEGKTDSFLHILAYSVQSLDSLSCLPCIRQPQFQNSSSLSFWEPLCLLDVSLSFWFGSHSPCNCTRHGAVAVRVQWIRTPGLLPPRNLKSSSRNSSNTRNCKSMRTGWVVDEDAGLQGLEGRGSEWSGRPHCSLAQSQAQRRGLSGPHFPSRGLCVEGDQKAASGLFERPVYLLLTK